MTPSKYICPPIYKYMSESTIEQVYNDFFSYQRILKKAEAEYAAQRSAPPSAAIKQHMAQLAAVIRDVKEEIAAIQKILRTE